MKIKIDKKLCISCGACAVVAENIFELNDKGEIIVKSQPGKLTESVKDAIESCPVDAIKIEDDKKTTQKNKN